MFRSTPLGAPFTGHNLRPEDHAPAGQPPRHGEKQDAALSAIQARQTNLGAAKGRSKPPPKHIKLKDLPAEQRIAQTAQPPDALH